MPAITIGETATLYDSAGMPLGDFQIEEIRYDAFCGSFIPASGFDLVRALFAEFSTAVNAQSFVHAGAIASEIEKFGIWAKINNEAFRIHDVQLYEDDHRFHGSFRQAA